MAISLSIMEHTDIIHFPIQQQNRLISRGGSRLLSLLDFSGSLQVINVYCSLSLLVLEGWPVSLYACLKNRKFAFWFRRRFSARMTAILLCLADVCAVIYRIEPLVSANFKISSEFS